MKSMQGDLKTYVKLSFEAVKGAPLHTHVVMVTVTPTPVAVADPEGVVWYRHQGSVSRLSFAQAQEVTMRKTQLRVQRKERKSVRKERRRASAAPYTPSAASSAGASSGGGSSLMSSLMSPSPRRSLPSCSSAAATPASASSGATSHDASSPASTQASTGYEEEEWLRRGNVASAGGSRLASVPEEGAAAIAALRL